MASTLKTVSRPVADESETPLVGHGLPLQEEVAVEAEQSAASLEESIELAADHSLLMLERDSIEQKRERVEKMFDRVAVLVAQLSPELCKEDHGRYMALSAQTEQLCLCIEARLVSLGHDVQALEITDVPLVVWLFQFTDRARRIIHARAERIRKRDADVAIIRSWQGLVGTQRQRPAKIHEEAVQHVKRLMLQEDENHRALNHLIAALAEREGEASRKGYFEKRDELLADIRTLKAEQPRLEQEAYDRALKKVQESDNGSRPK